MTTGDGLNTEIPRKVPVKDDRNTHEGSGDESHQVENRDRQTSGGGHRSGSRGAGTSENEGKSPAPGQGPKSRDGRIWH